MSMYSNTKDILADALERAREQRTAYSDTLTENVGRIGGGIADLIEALNGEDGTAKATTEYSNPDGSMAGSSTTALSVSRNPFLDSDTEAAALGQKALAQAAQGAAFGPFGGLSGDLASQSLEDALAELEKAGTLGTLGIETLLGGGEEEEESKPSIFKRS